MTTKRTWIVLALAILVLGGTVALVYWNDHWTPGPGCADPC